MSLPDAARTTPTDPPAPSELIRSLSSLLDAANDETLEQLLANPVATAAVFLRLADERRRRGGLGDAPMRPGSPRRPSLSPEDATRWLDERTVRRPRPVDTIGSAGVARLLGLGSRQAVHARLGAGRLIGFEGTRRGTQFPTAQFLDGGRVVDGLAELTDLLGGGWTLWCWLDEPLDLLHDARPIARLRAGDAEAVVAAARSEAQGDFH